MPTIFPNKWVICKALIFFLVSELCPFLHFHYKDHIHCFWYNRTNSNFLQIAAEFLMRTCPWLVHLRAWDLGLLFSSWLDILLRKIKKSVTALKRSHQGQSKLSLAMIKHLYVGTKVKGIEDWDALISPLAKVHRNHSCLGALCAAGQRRCPTMP